MIKSDNNGILINPKICIVTDPRPLAAIVPLSNLTDIISTLASFLYLLTGNEGRRVLTTHRTILGHSITYRPNHFILTRMLNHIIMQVKYAYRIIRINKKIDIYVVFMGENLLVSILICKMFRKHVILMLAGSQVKISARNQGLLSKLMLVLQQTDYFLADKIVLYSEKLIREWDLTKYVNKISIAHEHFLDNAKFNIQRQYINREKVVGYIGRLSEEKGIINFIQAISVLVKEKSDIKFFVGGDGNLREYIKDYLGKEILDNRVEFTGWISHDDLPSHLNQLKLLVIPSFTEGLPNIMLEAMACGTPVLATPVGAIPDIIFHGETGFIMENNSPQCIAQNIISALNHINLEKIIAEGRKIIETDFTFEKVQEKYRNVLTKW